jgi:hypothetical protein
VLLKEGITQDFLLENELGDFNIPDHIESIMFETNCDNTLDKVKFPQNHDEIL